MVRIAMGSDSPADAVAALGLLVAAFTPALSKARNSNNLLLHVAMAYDADITPEDPSIDAVLRIMGPSATLSFEDPAPAEHNVSDWRAQEFPEVPFARFVKPRGENNLHLQGGGGLVMAHDGSSVLASCLLGQTPLGAIPQTPLSTMDEAAATSLRMGPEAGGAVILLFQDESGLPEHNVAIRIEQDVDRTAKQIRIQGGGLLLDGFDLMRECGLRAR